MTALVLVAGCNPPPTVSLVIAPERGTVPPLTELSRLRLIIRTCDSNQPALAQDVPLGDGDKPRLEAAVLPGTTFYAWLQGWEACDPAGCEPEQTAQDDDCTCIGDSDAPAQIFRYEGCTGWVEAESSEQHPIPFAPKGTPRLCPPDPLPSSDCQTP